jgi:hypothetical protein
MRQGSSRVVSWPFAMLLVAIGGLAASGGVLLGWWDARAVRTTEIFGREILDERTLAGSSAWSGAATLAVGLVALVGGAVGLLRRAPALRGPLALLALVSGLLALAGAALGLAQGGGAAARALGGAGREVEASVAGGLVISGLGGLLVAAGGFLARTAAHAEEARPAGPAGVP